MLKLYLVTRLGEQSYGYDDYIAFVVCAENKEAAMKITNDEHTIASSYTPWPAAEKLHAKAIGAALIDTMPGIILDSFNAG
jgi:hypothetical protein